MHTLEIVSSIDQVEPHEWDALCGERPFVQHRWLRLTERVLAGYRPRYVLLRQAGTLEAAAICSVRDQFQNRFLRSTANWALQRFPCLRCGLPITFDSGLLVRPGVDQDQIWPALLSALDSCARREHASFVGIDHLAAEHAAWRSLERKRYHRAQLLTETYLPITWPSFEAYHAALPKKRRQRIRQIQRRAEQEGVVIAIEQPTAENAALLRGMIREVFERHGEPDTYVNDLLVQAAAILGDDFALLVARQHGQIVGCVGVLFSQGQIAAKWIGLDYARTLNTATYLAFNVALIELAITRGAQRLRMGATSYETKQFFGAVTEERFSALILRSRALNALAGAALQMTGGRVAALPQSTRSPKAKPA